MSVAAATIAALTVAVVVTLAASAGSAPSGTSTRTVLDVVATFQTGA